MKLDQIYWNILFEPITGTRCFLPEGCALPTEGLIVYGIVLLVFLASFGFFLKKKVLRNV